MLVTSYSPDSYSEIRDILNNKNNVVLPYEKKGDSQRTSSRQGPSVLNESPFFDPIKPQNGDGVNTQYTQDGAKYSVPPVLEAEETVERQGVVPEYTAQTGMEQFTDEQLREELRRRNPKANPLDIAQLTPEDADTTPELGKSTVRNRKGDGESAFAGSLQGADIFDDRLKELAATDNKISRYDRIANKETMDAANKALNEGGAAYARAWEHKNSNTFTAEDVAVGSKKRAGTEWYRRVFSFGLI